MDVNLKGILFTLLFSPLFSCNNSERFVDEFYKKKISHGKIVKTVDLQRCGLLVVYMEASKLDTITLNGNCMLIEQIDSLTVLEKRENSVDIYFKQLIKDNVRFSDTVDFVHYFDQEIGP